MNKKEYESIPASAFEFVPMEGRMHDKKLESKPIGYFRDAFNRFCRNKSSVVAAFIIVILFLYAILVPFVAENKYTLSLTDPDYTYFSKLPPKSSALAWMGVDGTRVEQSVNETNYNKYNAFYAETGYNPVVAQIGEPRVDPVQQAAYDKEVEKLQEQVDNAPNAALKKQRQKKLDKKLATSVPRQFTLKLDPYYLMGDTNGMLYIDLTWAEYKKVQNWQNDTGIQVIYPAVSQKLEDASVWYELDENGSPLLDENGNVVNIYQSAGKVEAQESYTGTATAATPFVGTATVAGYESDVTVDVLYDAQGYLLNVSVNVSGETAEEAAQYATPEFARKLIGQRAPFVRKQAGKSTGIDVVSGATVTGDAVIAALNEATANGVQSNLKVDMAFDAQGVVTACTVTAVGDVNEQAAAYLNEEFAASLIGRRAPFVLSTAENPSVDAVAGATVTAQSLAAAMNKATPLYTSTRIQNDDGSLRYHKVGGTETSTNYRVRVCLYNYFQYKYGFEAEFLFGTNTKGQDIFTRLASGARFSFILAIGVSAINMLIGAIYGAIQGYYGGVVDLVLDRISDVLNNVPFMVVTTLFQLHLAKHVGPVVALIFAFVLTGWIGMAARVRMQFYRFKGQEYILAARTLGASDFRLMFKHIFPNSLGTIITGSVLVIPGMIFSESSMTYLGIVNLESSTMTSVGTMLANGKDQLQYNPYIILFPALFVSMLMISFNLFGNGLRDAFNPSLRGAE